tara:strand:- start:147 stop:782 length:636 start_codon:yes stop_codon:yes gene_type:complete
VYKNPPNNMPPPKAGSRWARKSDEEFAEIVKKSNCIGAIVEAMGYSRSGGICSGAPLAQKGVRFRIEKLKLSTEHFNLKPPHRIQRKLKPVSELKSKRRSGHDLKLKMLKAGRAYICDICRCKDYKFEWFDPGTKDRYLGIHLKGDWYWQDRPLKLQVDHIYGRDGTDKDDELDNLRFLCPNCHTQTPNYARSSATTGIAKNTDKRCRRYF